MSQQDWKVQLPTKVTNLTSGQFALMFVGALRQNMSRQRLGVPFGAVAKSWRDARKILAKRFPKLAKNQICFDNSCAGGLTIVLNHSTLSAGVAEFLEARGANTGEHPARVLFGRGVLYPHRSDDVLLLLTDEITIAA